MKTLRRAAVIVGLLSMSSNVVQAQLTHAQIIDAKARQGRPLYELNECPHYWGQSQGGPFPFDTLALAGQWTNMPEYNDCQKFIVKNSMGQYTYGPLASIFVRFDINTVLASPVAFVPTGLGGPVRTVGSLFGTNTTTTTATGHLEAVAQIYSTGAYAPLGMKAGFNCLWLYWETPVTPQSVFESVMVHVNNQADCAKKPTSLQASGGVPLVVTRAGGGPVPPTARWDWDIRREEQYIGMPCPSGWCEFHKQSYKSSSAYGTPKGFYDEQYLASPTVSSAGVTLAAPRVRGTVFPETGLDTRGMTGYRAAKWLPVATVVLDIPSTAYHNKYGFDQAPLPLQKNARHSKVELCFAPSANPDNCPGPKPVDVCLKDVKNDGKWYSRFTAQDGKQKVYCVAYRPSEFNIQPPSVVRWRWTLRDETIWIACPAGCCEANSIQM